MGSAPVQPVVFDYQAWVQQFPAFANVNETQAQSYFDYAGLYFANCGWTAALKQAPMLLNLLTAHIAWLWAPRDGNGSPSSTGTYPPPSVVGRVSSAGEGSVSVSAEYQGNAGSPSAQWYNQTQWGAAYWTATLRLRSARYVRTPFPPPQAATLAAIPGFFGRGRAN